MSNINGMASNLFNKFKLKKTNKFQDTKLVKDAYTGYINMTDDSDFYVSANPPKAQPVALLGLRSVNFTDSAYNSHGYNHIYQNLAVFKAPRDAECIVYFNDTDFKQANSSQTSSSLFIKSSNLTEHIKLFNKKLFVKYNEFYSKGNFIYSESNDDNYLSHYTKLNSNDKNSILLAQDIIANLNPREHLPFQFFCYKTVANTIKQCTEKYSLLEKFISEHTKDIKTYVEDGALESISSWVNIFEDHTQFTDKMHYGGIVKIWNSVLGNDVMTQSNSFKNCSSFELNFDAKKMGKVTIKLNKEKNKEEDSVEVIKWE